jgi:hypothetical protein
MILKEVTKGARFKTFISKTARHEIAQNPKKIHPKLAINSKNPSKIRVSARHLVKIHVSQVFLNPIHNHESARSVHLEAAYIEALL